MRRYGKWAPTSFDRSGAFLPDRSEWLVAPVTRTRDSGPLDESNFETFLKMLRDARCRAWELHRFGHWGPGWFEIVLLKPGSKAEAVGAEAEAALENYPVLDEEDYSSREWDAASDNWRHLPVRERVRLIQEDGGPSVFAARRDEIPQDFNGYLFDRIRPE